MTIKAFTEGLNNISFREMKEFFELHQELNFRDADDEYEKEVQVNVAWWKYTRPFRVRRPRGLNTHQEMNYHLGVAYSVAQIQDDFETAYAYLETMDSLVLESEIAEYESILAKDDVYAWLHESDNDIAYETATAITKAKEERKLQLSKIAADAVTKRVYYGTVLRFMNEMCKDDHERTFFLAEYASAQWRDGNSC